MHNITLSFQGFSVEWSALPENSQVALATLGFSTKIKNSIAGMKKAVLGEGPAPWSDDDIAAEAARLGLSVFGRDEATELTESQVLWQCRTYIAAVRLAAALVTP